MDRRKFINRASTIGASFAAGYAAHALFQGEGMKTILGEEWRNDRKVNDADLKDLPGDEAILAEAKANIDKNRKATAILKFFDHSGAPIANQQIKVTQIDHQMDWGIAFGQTNAGLVNPANRKRGELQKALFNCVTAKCYWNERWHQPIESSQGVRIYDLFLEEAEWGHQNGMRIKGHPLVWTVEKAIPRWVFKYPYKQQLDFLKNHVQKLIEVAGDKVSRWDLCNEMLWEPAFKNIAKRHWPHLDPIEDIADYIATALEWARAINPNAIYSLNDYGLVLTYVKEISASGQRDRYLQLVEALKARNALPDAIGNQAHIGGKFPLGAFQRSIDHLSQSQVPLQITEFWSKEKDFPEHLSPKAREEAMAKYIGDIYTVAFAHNNISHFTFWGGQQLYTEEGNPRRPYEVLHSLIKDQWMTQTQVETNAEGEIRFTGFKGQYQLQIADQEIHLDLVEQTEKIITLKH